MTTKKGKFYLPKNSLFSALFYMSIIIEYNNTDTMVCVKEIKDCHQ